MSEFLTEGSHQTSADPIETPVTEPQAQPDTQPEAPPQAFTVKYNKEEMQIPYDQAPDYIQKGLNYEKVQQRATTYEQQLQRLAQMSGYQTLDELNHAIEQYEKAQERQRYEQAGIDPDTFNQLLSQHPDIQYAQQLRQEQEQQARISQEVSELRSMFPDVEFDQIPQAAWQLKEQSGISLLDAYLRTNYQTLAQQKEQEAIQKLQNNQTASPGTLSGGDTTHNVSVSQLSAKDFKQLKESVLRGERRTF
ncbi:hypothetical protein [Ectobacillus antri]|uniref:hypothetical protein n=1 Tax=Ectobacillus antri TaxID=2486280 RepID=UPI000F59A5E7|nr:hypothetical protein [Ectobacillus antri]